MPEIRVLFLGIGTPVPTFIRNRIVQLDKTGQIEAVVLAPQSARDDFQLLNGIILSQLPVCFNLRKTVLPILWFCVRFPASTIRLWQSLDLYTGRVRLRKFIKFHSLVHIKRINIVHFQWIVSPDEIKWARTFFRVPVIISARGSQLTVYPATEPGYEDSIRESLAAADYIHAVSQSMAEACIRFGANSDKINVNYNGIEIGRLGKYQNRNRPGDELQLISIGTLMWRKGFIWQLQLIMELNKSGIKARLKIIGDGPDRQGLQYTILRLGIRDAVTLEGQKPPEEVIRSLQTSDIYISTSAAEGLSNAVLEAVACGLPVVAFDCEGMNEVIENGFNGFIVPFGDIVSMAEKIRNIYNTRQMLETMGSNGALLVVEKYDYKKHVSSLLEYYKSVCRSDE